jgi:hypothetical protein
MYPAPNYRFGLGVRLSNSTPTLNNSITGKYFCYGSHCSGRINFFWNKIWIGEVCWRIHKPTNIDGLKWFYGAGAYVGFENGDTYLGPTGILGLDYKFTNVPINLRSTGS